MLQLSSRLEVIRFDVLADVTLCNVSSNLSLHSGPPKSLLQVLIRLANPRKFRISVTGVGDFHSNTSCTLLGSTATPFADRMWPRKETSFSQNWHLLSFAYH